ncbi:aminoacyl-tRNA hydrolase [bacterium]|nr:aminoacyl-tRNA hydrolase [bacterium]
MNEHEIYFLRTTTLYMNESGIYLKEFLDYYKVEVEDVIIVYDELNYELGEIKLKISGSAGGHNGMKDIIKYLNTMDVKRIRLGISRPTSDIKDYVLARFNSHEIKTVDSVINKVNEIIND